MNKRALIILLFISFSIVCKAQIEQPYRFEMEMESTDQNFQIVPVQEGIFLVREVFPKTISLNNSLQLQVFFLDTDLNVQWETMIVIENGFKFRGYDSRENRLNILLTEGDYFPKRLMLVEMKHDSPSFLTYNYTNPIPFTLTKFEMIKNGALVGGIVDFRPILLFLPNNGDRIKVLPGFFKNKSELHHISNRFTDEFFQILTTEVNPQRRKNIIVRSFSEEGEPLVENVLESDEFHFLDGKVASVQLTKQIVTGTFSDRKQELSKGLFIANYSDFELENVQYYNYSDFENFFNYLKERKRNRLKERIKRFKVKGRKIRLKYRLAINHIIEHQDSYILVGEAYYPKYRSVNNSGFGQYGTFHSAYHDPYMNRIFDGYQYTHAVIIGMSKDGKVLWDNSFEINDAISFELENFVKVCIREKDIVLLYLFDHELKTKIIDKNKVVSAKNTVELKRLNENDEVKYKFENEEGLEYWYGGNVFFAHGLQRIKNLKDFEVQLNRKVFFINKIVVTNQ